MIRVGRALLEFVKKVSRKIGEAELLQMSCLCPNYDILSTLIEKS